MDAPLSYQEVTQLIHRLEEIKEITDDDHTVSVTGSDMSSEFDQQFGLAPAEPAKTPSSTQSSNPSESDGTQDTGNQNTNS
jgi:hypothetical protein